MPVIPYTANDFVASYSYINDGGTVVVSWDKLVWAAVTVGKASGDEYAYGIYSAAERIHRAAMIRAYLLEGPSGRIFQAVTYEMADPSERQRSRFTLA